MCINYDILLRLRGESDLQVSMRQVQLTEGLAPSQRRKKLIDLGDRIFVKFVGTIYCYLVIPA